MHQHIYENHAYTIQKLNKTRLCFVFVSYYIDERIITK
nr:MAG TPA: hypothetical protein [Caudoviricetes sp.]